MVYFSSKAKLFVLSVIILISAVILLLNPTFSNSYESRGKILSKKVFLLRTNTSGGFESFLINNQLGQVEDYSIYNFDRGDVINYNLQPENGEYVLEGDTVISLSSNQFSQELDEIQLTIAELEGELNVLTSGEKEEFIKQLESEVERTKIAVETQQKIYDRAISLAERDIISREDFDIIEGELAVSKAEVQIAEDILAAAKSGAKKEEVEAVKRKIEAAKKISEELAKKYSNLQITAPFDGSFQTYANNDTLLTITSVKDHILTLPLPVSKLNQINIGDTITLNTEFGTKKLTVATIDGNTFFYNREPYFKIISESFASDEALPDNGIINCNVEFGTIDIQSYLEKLIN